MGGRLLLFVFLLTACFATTLQQYTTPAHSSDSDSHSLHDTAPTTDDAIKPTTPNTPWHWDEEFEAMVHPFWKQFEPIPDAYHYLVAIIITILGVCGVFGNILVLYIFGTVRSLRTPANYFVMNLAVSDLTFMAVNGFPLLTISSINTRWAWGSATCQMYGFIGAVFGFISINTNALIALDRYFVIAQPFQALKRMTKTRAIVMICLVWVWSLMWSLPPFFGYGKYVPEGFQTSCTFDYLTQTKGNILFNVGMYVFDFTLPVMVIIYCYYKIVKAVRHHEIEMMKLAEKLCESGNKAVRIKTGDNNKADVKAAKMSLLIVFLYLLAWTPYALVCLVALIGYRNHLNPYTSELPVLFAKSSAVYNPIIYAISHPKFRVALSRIFPWVICCCPPQPKELAMSNATTSMRTSRQTISPPPEGAETEDDGKSGDVEIDSSKKGQANLAFQDDKASTAF